MGEAVIAGGPASRLRITLLDTCYLHGGIGRPSRTACSSASATATLDAWVRRVSAALRSTTATPAWARPSTACGPWTPDEAATVAAWAKQNEIVPLHAHVSEQPAENEACLAAYGRTPTEVLADAGAVSERFSAVHATHVTVRRTSGRARGSPVVVCLCPTTERDLADGIGPSAALAAAGVRLCLGSDSHAVIDLFEEARAVELDERLATGARGHHSARELLQRRHAGRRRRVRLARRGRPAPAARGRPHHDPARQPPPRRHRPADALAAVVFAATAADVSHVVVGRAVDRVRRPPPARRRRRRGPGGRHRRPSRDGRS